MKSPEKLTDEELKPYVREWFSRNRLSRKSQPRAKVKRPCPTCKKMFGARDLRAHKPSCPKRQQKKAA
jgi:hypothetical protein